MMQSDYIGLDSLTVNGKFGGCILSSVLYVSAPLQSLIGGKWELVHLHATEV